MDSRLKLTHLLQPHLHARPDHKQVMLGSKYLDLVLARFICTEHSIGHQAELGTPDGVLREGVLKDLGVLVARDEEWVLGALGEVYCRGGGELEGVLLEVLRGSTKGQQPRQEAGDQMEKEWKQVEKAGEEMEEAGSSIYSSFQLTTIEKQLEPNPNTHNNPYLQNQFAQSQVLQCQYYIAQHKQQLSLLLQMTQPQPTPAPCLPSHLTHYLNSIQVYRSQINLLCQLMKLSPVNYDRTRTQGLYYVRARLQICNQYSNYAYYEVYGQGSSSNCKNACEIAARDLLTQVYWYFPGLWSVFVGIKQAKRIVL